MNWFFYKYRWFAIGMLALLVRYLLGLFPDFALQVYQNAFYQVFRIVWDSSFGLIGFPLIYLFIIVLLFYLFIRLRRSKKVFSFYGLLAFVLNSLGILLFVFLLFWGYNYAVPGLAERNNFRTQSIEDERLLESYYAVSQSLKGFRDQLPNQIITEELLSDNLENEIRAVVESSLAEMDYTLSGNVRCRFVSESGWMRRMGISGIYFPFVGEAHCDASQAAIPKVFTLAHEISHGYGITNEGEANFVAWLSLQNSQNVMYHYIAGIELMTEILIEFRNRDYENYLDKRDELPFWVKEDLNHIRQNAMNYPPLFPRFSYAMNDAYLKSQGVSEGIQSYDEMLNLILAYKKTFLD